MLNRRSVPLFEAISSRKLEDCIRRTPVDEYVVWTGEGYRGRDDRSVRAHVLALVNEAWRPMQLRDLVIQAARMSGDTGIDPDRVRSAVRMHQSAVGACCFLVRRTPIGDYVAAVDIPTPSTGRRIFSGEVVLRREDANPRAAHGGEGAPMRSDPASHKEVMA